MGKYWNVGNAGFETIRNGRYVDKTGMISFINSTLNTTDKLTMVSRPRRFGKSFAAKMLCAYYDKSCDSRRLFDGLAISADPSYEKHLNRYDVIYLDITEFTSEALIHGTMPRVVLNIQEAVIGELSAAYPQVEKSDSLPNMLYGITEKTGQKFLFIIDECDAIFREAKEDTALQRAYIGLIRGLFKNSAATDKTIAGAYLTGILPLKKYGSQSAVSDFREYSMLTPKQLAQYVGFTESEVQALCQRNGMDFEEMKRWYDGYSFPRVKSVYSPNSVMEAVKSGEFGSHWTRTETYESLKLYIEMNFDGLKEAIVQMLGGARIQVDVETFQNDMTEIKSRDNVLTLLIHLGYLAYDAGDGSVFIPNEEVRKEFIRAVTTGKYTEIAKLLRHSEQLLEATLDMDEEAVAAAIEEAHSAGAAPTFYNNEQALRSVVRVAYLSCVDEYLRIDELPSGRGYADVVFFPKKASALPLLLVELKWNNTDKGAIGQIKNNDYPRAIKDYGGDMLLVGINYDAKTKKHTCRIEKISR